MCGIIGIVGKEEVAERLVDGLRRMEYRGYDSAGVCTLHNGQLIRRRAEPPGVHAPQQEIDVDEVGVVGAKDFFEAKVSSGMKRHS